MFNNDPHRKLAFKALLLITPMTIIAHSTVLTAWVSIIPFIGGFLGFLFAAVAATTIVWYTLFLTLLILGPTSHQLQYLIPMMGLIALIIYYITTVPVPV